MPTTETYGVLTALAKELGVSRQRAWQIVNRESGLCHLCGTPTGRFTTHAGVTKQYSLCVQCRQKAKAKYQRVGRSKEYEHASTRP